MRKLRWLVVLTALGVVATACGRDDDDDTAGPTTQAAAQTTAAAAPTTGGETATSSASATTGGATTTTAKDLCEGVTLEATEIGVTADTITVTVMADVGSALAPGLFQGSIDAVKGWAEDVNAKGGVGCRQVKVEEADSKIDPSETTNGFLKGCAGSLAMVGTNALFALDVKDLETCPDKAGAATGIPDLPGLSVAPAQACSKVSYVVQVGGGSCPYSGQGPRDYDAGTGIYAFKWVVDNVIKAPPHGVGLMAPDIPSTKESSYASFTQAVQATNATVDGVFGVSGRDDQSTYAPYVLRLKDEGSNFAYPNSNDQAMIKWRNEALVQGLDPTTVTWYCSLSCYTDSFKQAGDAVKGTYVGMNFLPFEEADVNEEMARYLAAVDTPAGFGADSWAAAVLFEQVIQEIVETDGPNAITRKKVLETLATVTDFDANGMFGTIDIGNRLPSKCFVVLQWDGSEFVRVHPTEKGTFDCDQPTAAKLTNFDAIAEYTAVVG
jgi:ABC-type branched-subunit amino acid transport system substrate-binding protein